MRAIWLVVALVAVGCGDGGGGLDGLQIDEYPLPCSDMDADGYVLVEAAPSDGTPLLWQTEACRESTPGGPVICLRDGLDVIMSEDGARVLIAAVCDDSYTTRSLIVLR